MTYGAPPFSKAALIFSSCAIVNAVSPLVVFALTSAPLASSACTSKVHRAHRHLASAVSAPRRAACTLPGFSAKWANCRYGLKASVGFWRTPYAKFLGTMPRISAKRAG